MKLKKLICILFFTLIMLMFTGCWNYREVENLSMVSAFAIDKGQEGHKYHITYEFLDLTKEKPGSKIVETEGDTIFDAGRETISKNGKKMFYSDCKTLIISNDIAAEAITPLLDWISRDSEPRANLNIFISKEKTAGEILQQKPVSESLIGLEIWKMIQQNTVSLSEAPDIKLYQVNNTMQEEGISTFLPALKISESKSGKQVQLDGGAVFNKEKLVGFMEKSDTKFVLMAMNKVKGGLLVFQPPKADSGITLEIISNKTTIKPEVTGGTASFRINIETDTALAENQATQNYCCMSGIEETKREAAKFIEEKVTQSIKKLQNEYGSDVIGFGSILHQDNPEFWEKVKGDWDKNFHKMQFTVSAKVIIENTATAKGRIKVG